MCFWSLEFFCLHQTLYVCIKQTNKTPLIVFHQNQSADVLDSYSASHAIYHITAFESYWIKKIKLRLKFKNAHWLTSFQSQAIRKRFHNQTRAFLSLLVFETKMSMGKNLISESDSTKPMDDVR